MHASDLQRLYDYHYWANIRLLGAVEKLTPEQFTRSVAGSYGSVRNTLVHALSAEWGWLGRCGGPPRGEKLRADNYPTVESVVTECRRVEGFGRAFLAGLSDDDLMRPIAFAIDGGPAGTIPLGDLMQHAAIHGVHHRGQVAMLVRMLDHVPGDFDFLMYAPERAASATARGALDATAHSG